MSTPSFDNNLIRTLDDSKRLMNSLDKFIQEEIRGGGEMSDEFAVIQLAFEYAEKAFSELKKL